MSHDGPPCPMIRLVLGREAQRAWEQTQLYRGTQYNTWNVPRGVALQSRSVTRSLLQGLWRPVVAEPLGRHLARVLDVVAPVRLLLAVALVPHGPIAVDVDELGDQLAVDALGASGEVRFDVVRVQLQQAAQHVLVLRGQVAAGAVRHR